MDRPCKLQGILTTSIPASLTVQYKPFNQCWDYSALSIIPSQHISVTSGWPPTPYVSSYPAPKQMQKLTGGYTKLSQLLIISLPDYNPILQQGADISSLGMAGATPQSGWVYCLCHSKASCLHRSKSIYLLWVCVAGWRRMLNPAQLLLCTCGSFSGVHAQHIVPHFCHHVKERGLSVQLPAVITGGHGALSLTGIPFTEAPAEQFVQAENKALSLWQGGKKTNHWAVATRKTIPCWPQQVEWLKNIMAGSSCLVTEPKGSQKETSEQVKVATCFWVHKRFQIQTSSSWTLLRGFFESWLIYSFNVNSKALLLSSHSQYYT